MTVRLSPPATARGVPQQHSARWGTPGSSGSPGAHPHQELTRRHPGQPAPHKR